MADNDSSNGGDEAPVPFMQELLDSPFILLTLGVSIPMVFYVIWGIIEVTQIPIAP